MGKRKSWVVQATKTKLSIDLGDGTEWLEVKDRLTVGEERDLADRAMGQYIPDLDNPANETAMKVEVNMSSYPIFRVLAWAVDWSLVDHKGNLLPVNLVNIRVLDPEAFNAISKALDAHVQKLEDAKKPADPTTPHNNETDARPPSPEGSAISAPTSTPS